MSKFVYLPLLFFMGWAQGVLTNNILYNIYFNCHQYNMMINLLSKYVCPLMMMKMPL